MRGALACLVLLVAGCVGPTGPSGAPGSGSGSAPPAGTILLTPDAPSIAAGTPLREREGNAAIDPADGQHMAITYTELTSDPVLPVGAAFQPILPGLLRNAVALSHDGGATWANVRLPYASMAPPTSLWNLVCWTFDPTVGIDAQGLVHLFTLYIGCGGPGYGSTSGLLHAMVDEHGVGDPDIAWLSGGGIAGAFNDRAWGAVDAASGTLGWAWTLYAGGGTRTLLFATFSTDHGKTWSTPETLAEEGPLPAAANYLVHATWTPDGQFLVSAYGCDASQQGDPPFEKGQCLWQFSGKPGGPWAKAELALSACPGAPDGAGFGYASGAAGPGTRFAAAPVFQNGNAVGVCVFGSPDQGKNWPAATFLGAADHPTLAVAPDGSVLVGLLAGNTSTVTPTLHLLDGATLGLLTSAPLAAPYDDNPTHGPLPNYGDYDGMDARGGRWLWMLTRPHEGDPQSGAAGGDLDVGAFRGGFAP